MRGVYPAVHDQLRVIHIGALLCYARCDALRLGGTTITRELVCFRVLRVG